MSAYEAVIELFVVGLAAILMVFGVTRLLVSVIKNLRCAMVIGENVLHKAGFSVDEAAIIIVGTR